MWHNVLRFPSAKLAKDLSDRHGFQTSAEQLVPLFGPGGYTIKSLPLLKNACPSAKTEILNFKGSILDFVYLCFGESVLVARQLLSNESKMLPNLQRQQPFDACERLHRRLPNCLDRIYTRSLEFLDVRHVNANLVSRARTENDQMALIIPKNTRLPYILKLINLLKVVIFILFFRLSLDLTIVASSLHPSARLCRLRLCQNLAPRCFELQIRQRRKIETK